LLCDAFAAYEAARAEVSLTYFEFATLAALLLFQDAGLMRWCWKWALGSSPGCGQYIDPDIAVVTSYWARSPGVPGDTRDSVAFEKSRHIAGLASGLVCSETIYLLRSFLKFASVSSKAAAREDHYGWHGRQRTWRIFAS